MAIYRFESGGDVKFASDHIELRGYMPNFGFGGPPKSNFLANGISVTKETYDRLLAELEANEAGCAAGAESDEWKPASEPPDDKRDVAVKSGVSSRSVAGYFDGDKWWTLGHHGAIRTTNITHWHELPKPPSTPPQPEPQKEPEPVWQGPGWYECIQFGEPKLVVRSSSGCSTVRGVTIFESDLTRLIRLATDEELRHVCTHGTEPDSRPEVG